MAKRPQVSLCFCQNMTVQNPYGKTSIYGGKEIMDVFTYLEKGIILSNVFL